MTNDKMALASNLKEILYRPKCDDRDDSHVWVTSFPHLLILSHKEESLNTKAVITYNRPTPIGLKLTNYKQLASTKAKNN